VKIYATYNIKGGVGKTTTAVNLAYLAATESKLRTVLWDLDPQAAASFMFRVKPRVKGGGKALIRGTRPLDDAIKGTDFDNLDLIPADFTYRNMDLLLDSAGGKPGRKLAKLLAGVGERAARRGRDRGAAHPHNAVGADAGPADGIRRGIRRPPPGRARVLFDG
jgi:cellulose biosynthesis protein BcsQ